MVGAWGEDACSTEVVSSTVVVDELPLTAGDNGCLYAGAAYVFLRYGIRWRLQVNLAAAALLHCRAAALPPAVLLCPHAHAPASHVRLRRI